MLTAMAKRVRSMAALGAAMLVFAASTGPAPGQERSAPGEFDFYVLALSWSPSFCEATAERSPDRVPREQCGERPYSFVVHGLWPQFERGFPQRCEVPSPRLNRDIVSSMLDLMPARRLVYHEWDTHGTCSGLSPRAYFETVRKARAAVTIPEQADLAGELGADVVIPEGANATQSIQKVRDVFGARVDTAIHVAGDRSVVAGVVWSGGRFTSVTDVSTSATRGAGYVPTIVAPSGHKLANLLFKVASHRLRSRVYRTLSFDQVADAVNPRSDNTDGRIVLVR